MNNLLSSQASPQSTVHFFMSLDAPGSLSKLIVTDNKSVSERASNYVANFSSPIIDCIIGVGKYRTEGACSFLDGF